MTSVVISGLWVSSFTSCSAAIHHSAATVDKSAAGIVAIIAKDVKSYCLNQFVKVSGQRLETYQHEFSSRILLQCRTF